MRISKFCSMITLVSVSAALAHAGTRVPVVLAEIVPEPSTTMVGAGLLLVGLAVARQWKKK